MSIPEETINTLVNIQEPVVTTGGTIQAETIDENYKYMVFPCTGFLAQTSYTVNSPEETECDILIVGGGGAGGGNGQGGGGGAGAVIYYEGLMLNGNYNIKVGKGANATNTQNSGDNGSDSEFLKIDNTQRFLAKGGGGGGTWKTSGYLAKAGGSGGGGAGDGAGASIVSGNIVNDVSISVVNNNYVNSNFTGDRGVNNLDDTGCFGNKGGDEPVGGDVSIGAGGGSAGQVEFPAVNLTTTTDISGDGGNGKKYDITGIEKYYGGGGGGGMRSTSSEFSTGFIVGEGCNGGGGDGGGGGVNSPSSNGFDGENGTGGGGGGVGGAVAANFRGGKGGSGNSKNSL